MSVHKEIKLFNNDIELLSVIVSPSVISVAISANGNVATTIQNAQDMRRLARFILDEVKEEDAK